MRYADQHMHCSCSEDSNTPIYDMVVAARDAGLSAVCFTDHMDLANGLTGETDPQLEARWPLFLQRRTDLAAAPQVEGVEVRFGMELGEATQAPDVAAQAAAKPGIDFIIASVHNLPNVPDFYFAPYHSEEDCERLNRLYLQELLRTAELDCFDVIGHLNYTSRYMARDGFQERITVAKYGDELTALLKRLIERGKGIECNTSGFRGNGTEPFPNEEILRLYRSLGGEIITVGSDSHITSPHCMRRIPYIYDLLKSCGFPAVCEFKNRECLFLDL